MSIFPKTSGIPFVRKHIDIEYKISNNLEEVKLKHKIRGFFDKVLRSKDKTYEIRYITFGYDDNVKIDDFIYSAYAVFVQTVLLNIAESEENIRSAHNFKDSDVNLEFNASKGITSIIKGEGTYTQGYKYVMVNFFFNKEYGIVTQMVLFNNLEDLQNNKYMKDLHSFKFKS
jgi:hypothetical protein